SVQPLDFADAISIERLDGTIKPARFPTFDDATVTGSWFARGMAQSGRKEKILDLSVLFSEWAGCPGDCSRHSSVRFFAPGISRTQRARGRAYLRRPSVSISLR